MENKYIQTPNEAQESKERASRSKKMMTWLVVVAIVMFFAAFTSAYIVVRGNYWVQFDLPNIFWISTGLIVLSSVTMFLAMKAVRNNNQGAIKLYVLITLALGLGFLGSQYSGWKLLYSNGFAFRGDIANIKGEYGKDYTIVYYETDQDGKPTGRSAPMNYIDGNLYDSNDLSLSTPLNDKVKNTFNGSSAYLYLLTGLHFIHVLVGIFILLIVLFKSLNNKYSSENPLGMELCSIYWHFLDGLWVYLFFFLLFIR